MFNSKTVFIVGAGASAELGFPVGEELRSQIVSKVGSFPVSQNSSKSGDSDLLQQVSRTCGFEIDMILVAGKAIQNGIYGKASIDEFLEWHGDNEILKKYGKAAIAKCILEAEQKSAEQNFGGVQKHFNLSGFSKNWYGKLFVSLTSGLRKMDKPDVFQNVRFVSFNYDRSLEYFLFHALQTQGYSKEEATAECSRRDVFMHPYGTIAPLFGSGNVTYGCFFGAPDCAEISKNIRTYSEQVDDQDDIISIRSVIAEAEVLIFLGFYYNQQNLRLLKPTAPTNVKRILGTAFKRSEKDVLAIQNDLYSFLWKSHGLPPKINPDPRISIEIEKCTDLFNTFSHTITRPA